MRFHRPAVTTSGSDPAATLTTLTRPNPSDTVIFFGVDTMVHYVMTDKDIPFNWRRFRENAALVMATLLVIVGAVLIIGTLLADSWVGRLLRLGISILR
jgi:hypothetical protein